jgi:hypothetical protein
MADRNNGPAEVGREEKKTKRRDTEDAEKRGSEKKESRCQWKRMAGPN